MENLGEMHKELGINFNISKYYKKEETYYKLYLKINKENVKRFRKLNLFNKSIASKGEFCGLKKKEILKKLEKKLN